MRSNNPGFLFKYFVLGIFLFLIVLFLNANLRLIGEQNHETERNSYTGRFEQSKNKIRVLPFAKARFDNRRLIRIYDWIETGSKWDDLMNYFNVCLSTQASMDRIHWIREVVEYWRGPVSLAVYITSSQEWIGLNLLVNHFQKCYPIFRDFVSIHVAIPSEVKQLNTTSDNSFPFEEVSCDDTEEYIRMIVDEYSPDNEKNPLMTAYPQNHMRNIARKNCGTEYVLSTDIDIIPRPDSAKHLQEFLDSEEARNCKKCAFVIPTYELNSTLPYPSSKTELVQYWEAKEARPFHFNVFIEAHNATDYFRWSQTNLEEEPIKISHKSVRKLMKYYEPFYIAPDIIPAFEERFVGYGFTRNSQAQESLAEGWTFKVLTPIFAIHWGMQSMKTLISPGNKLETRKQQTKDNGVIFKAFMKELEFRKTLHAAV